MALLRRTLITGSVVSAGATLLGAGYVTGASRTAVAAAIRRVERRSALIETRFGMLEYAVSGIGEPLLMVHGTGGGFDQGLRFSQGLLERGFQIVAPSRFGYLRSDFPADPSPQNQADAFAKLLDHLDVERLAVVGGSAGALSAACFALQHPDRCSKLGLLVPAGNLSQRDPVEFTPLQQFSVKRLLTSDYWFWAALRLAPEQLIGSLLATDPDLLERVSAEERQRAYLILNELMPISLKTQGIAADGYYAGTPTDIDFPSIRVPLLLLSAEDDRFGTAQTARSIAASIPSARLRVFPTGGHIWLGHDNDIADEVATFVRTA